MVTSRTAARPLVFWSPALSPAPLSSLLPHMSFSLLRVVVAHQLSERAPAQISLHQLRFGEFNQISAARSAAALSVLWRFVLVGRRVQVFFYTLVSLFRDQCLFKSRQAGHSVEPSRTATSEKVHFANVHSASTTPSHMHICYAVAVICQVTATHPHVVLDVLHLPGGYPEHAGKRAGTLRPKAQSRKSDANQNPCTDQARRGQRRDGRDKYVRYSSVRK